MFNRDEFIALAATGWEIALDKVENSFRYWSFLKRMESWNEANGGQRRLVQDEGGIEGDSVEALLEEAYTLAQRVPSDAEREFLWIVDECFQFVREAGGPIPPDLAVALAHARWLSNKKAADDAWLARHLESLEKESNA
jgi:hypothetical protein